MQIKNVCYLCEGTGSVFTTDPYYPPTEITCPYCDGVGYLTKDIIGSELTDTLSKLDEIKTKQNQMQADINYIKAKVG